MKLRERLAVRMGIAQIEEILYELQENPEQYRVLGTLIFDADERISYQALWVCTHISYSGNEEWFPSPEKLMARIATSPCSGSRRLMLNLLWAQPQPEELSAVLLDYCLEKMISPAEPAAIRSICLKLAFRICTPIPELMQELHSVLEMMQEESSLPASLKAARKNLKCNGKR